jgi:hypothetical protein
MHGDKCDVSHPSVETGQNVAVFIANIHRKYESFQSDLVVVLNRSEDEMYKLETKQAVVMN